MPSAISRYLEEVKGHLSVDHASRTEVIRELETHIEDRLTEMKEAGMSDEDAANVCLRLLGSARMVARAIYESQSQGTWRQALMASVPHLLFALLFLLNWWQEWGWLAVVIGVVLGTAFYAWFHGRPIWLFPWLGYLLVPVIGSGLMLLYLPRGWSWLAIVVYVPLACWLIRIVAVQTVKRDWAYGALMLLPVPVVIAWFVVGARGNWFLGLDIDQIRQLANSISLSFVALAVTAVVFIRIRQRWLRISVLITSGICILATIASYSGGRLSFGAFLLLALMTVGLLISPALLDRRMRHKGTKALERRRGQVEQVTTH